LIDLTRIGASVAIDELYAGVFELLATERSLRVVLVERQRHRERQQER